MSLITRFQFNNAATQAEVDTRVNSLLVPEDYFSRVSGLYHRWYGVITGAADGEQAKAANPLEPNRSETKDRLIINPCLRDQYGAISSSVQQSMERALGWLTTPRYLIEEISFKGERAYQLPYPGVEKLNVELVWHTLEGYNEITISPFMQRNVTVTARDVNTWGATISRRQFNNPNDIWLRKDAYPYEVYHWFHNNQYPINATNTTWNLAINQPLTPYTDPTAVSVQHKKYIEVDIDPPTLPEGATIYPVYPGTNQIIPTVTESFEVVDDKWRFKFWIYTLVHPEFVNESIDLTGGSEFWKLYPYIEFRYTTEEVSYPRIVVVHANETTTFIGPEATENTQIGPDATLALEKYGIFHLNFDPCESTPAWNEYCRNWPLTSKLYVSYKVNPICLPYEYQSFIGRLKDAAAGRIAAELNTENCNCDVWGYIAQQKMPYGDAYVDSATKFQVDKIRYGEIHGQKRYTEIMNEAPIYKKPVFVLA